MRTPGDKGTAARADGLAPAYAHKLSRRDSLKLLAALAASAMLPALSACDSTSTEDAAVGVAGDGHWLALELQPVTAKGYGKDPDLMSRRRALAADVDAGPAFALAICVGHHRATEGSRRRPPRCRCRRCRQWVSAPYPDQQQDRLTVLSALAWLDDEAALRFSQPFTALGAAQQLAIIDDIAYDNDRTPRQFQRIAGAFARLRNLVLAAYFCTPEGMEDIGYLGNVAIAGDYPGPTPEAYRHLETVLAGLGLSGFAYPVG